MCGCRVAKPHASTRCIRELGSTGFQPVRFAKAPPRPVDESSIVPARPLPLNCLVSAFTPIPSFLLAHLAAPPNHDLRPKRAAGIQENVAGRGMPEGYEGLVEFVQHRVSHCDRECRHCPGPVPT